MRPSPTLMIPVFTANDGHYVAMKKVFDAYRRAGLKIQPTKCHLFQAKIKYFGHFISKDGVSPVPKYVKVVQKLPLPTNKTEARSFLGKVGYYRRYIKDYAAIAKPCGERRKQRNRKGTNCSDPLYGSLLLPFEASTAYITSPGISTI
jgi:hypothetical protein